VVVPANLQLGRCLPIRRFIVGRVWGFLSLLLFLAAAPLPADNPRISLKLENVTATEAAAALSRAAGVPVEVDPGLRGAAPRRNQSLEVKESYDWGAVYFADALRQLCDRYGLRPERRSGAYLLLEQERAPRFFWRNEVEVPPLGVRVFTRRISLDPVGMLKLEGEGILVRNPLRLHLACALPARDPEMIAGFENVTAQDDLGNLLVSGDDRSGNSGYSAVYPDEWSSLVWLTPPAPGARRLAWVTGDLIVYRDYRLYRVEVPLTRAAGGVRAEVEKAAVEVRRFGRVKDGDRAAAAPGGAPGAFFLEAQVQVPAEGSRIVGDDQLPFFPVLLTSSGAPARLAICRVDRNRGADGTTYNIHATYRDPGEEPVKAVFTLVRRSDPQKLLSFRLEDVRLPPEARPSSAGEGPAPARPFYARGGGTLVNRVLIQDRPAPPGTLLLGLSARADGKWSAVRWIDVGLGGNGTARLDDVKPGTYRVTRVYRPREGAQPSGSGRWRDSEVRVDVAARKETAPPPLRWVRDR
jgi:hypothetical protein